MPRSRGPASSRRRKRATGQRARRPRGHVRATRPRRSPARGRRRRACRGSCAARHRGSCARPTRSRSSSSTLTPAACSSSWTLAAIIGVAVGDRQHDRLDRRQPDRQLAAEVLDQDADEALIGAHQRPVDHHRPVLCVVGAGVAQAEAGGHVVVQLAGPKLPGATQRVGHVHVDLRAVERAVARVEVVAEPWLSSACVRAASLRSHSSSDPIRFSGRVDSSRRTSIPNSL